MSDKYCIKYEEKWIQRYRENFKLSDSALVTKCSDIKSDDDPVIISGIIHYFSMWKNITKTQRDILLNHLTNSNLSYYG